ncbi:MAG TPA: hypothetical protein VMW06_13360 [Desulfobacterales bacterium]|nr:hypothetical protein [Desulfobacterales bacterium]
MKKKKKPYPTVFTNIPRNELDKLLQDDEDKPMTKKTEQTSEKKARALKKSLTPEDISRMIAGWDDKTTVEWTYEFGVSYQTVLKMAEVIRKEDKTLCPKKKPKPRTREDVAKAGIALFRKKKSKK